MPLKHLNPYLDNTSPLEDAGVHLGRLEDHMDDLADHLNLRDALETALEQVEGLIQIRWPIPVQEDQKLHIITIYYFTPFDLLWGECIAKEFYYKAQLEPLTEIWKDKQKGGKYILKLYVPKEGFTLEELLAHMVGNGPTFESHTLQ